MTLADLEIDDKAIITKIKGRGAFRKRITEMGFVRGTEVKVVKKAPLHDPIEYQILNYKISLRKSEAALIDVVSMSEAQKMGDIDFNGTIDSNELKLTAHEKGKIIDVALIGNPNCGKTTLFNFASHSKEHTGNYAGVTVDAKLAKFSQNGYVFNITDLPGTYSLTTYSPEELYVRKHIWSEMPDVIVNVVDASNLERNLFLTTQLIDMDVKVVIALNMYDELANCGDVFDYEHLGRMLGIPIIPTVSSKGTGVKNLFDRIIEVYEDRDESVRHIHINYGEEIEKSIKNIQTEIWKNSALAEKFSSRFQSIKLLEKDEYIKESLQNYSNLDSIISVADKEIEKLENIFAADSETLITDAKYGFIRGFLKETYHRSGNYDTKNLSDKIDSVLTHKYWGYPIFILIVWLMFQATFLIGQYPMDWIESLVEIISNFIDETLEVGMLHDLLIDGIIGGVGGVIVFLPNIIILFVLISFMEDTGYMARAAFLMDKIMHFFGLHGKSFIPLIMGFGCNVPAIMSTRILENRNDRLLTSLIIPFMSCSARLPVYILIAGAVFPNQAGNIIFMLYAIGILIALAVAILFKKTIFRKKEVPFVMELPPYRIPTLKSIGLHAWEKAVQYLKKMGGIILVASIIIWALGYFPQDVEYSNDFASKVAMKKTTAQEVIDALPIAYESEIPKIENEKNRQVNSILMKKNAEKQEQSYISYIGHFIEPVIEPLGFDWKLGVSLISGFAAKEIVISTMGVLYQAQENDEEANLSKRISEIQHTSGDKIGQVVFDKKTAFGFLLFILAYVPCFATITAIRRETNSWGWAGFVVLYTTAIAWLLAFAVQHIF